MTHNELFAALSPACLALIEEQLSAMLDDEGDASLNQLYSPVILDLTQVLHDKVNDMVSQ